MQPKEYVQAALRTESKIGTLTDESGRQLDSRLVHAVMGLATESGEIIDAAKRLIFYGRPLDRDNLIEEMGDICWYLAVLSDFAHVDLEDVMAGNIAKLKKRFPDCFSNEQAINRKPASEMDALRQSLKIESEIKSKAESKDGE